MVSAVAVTRKRRRAGGGGGELVGGGFKMDGPARPAARGPSSTADAALTGAHECICDIVDVNKVTSLFAITENLDLMAPK